MRGVGRHVVGALVGAALVATVLGTSACSGDGPDGPDGQRSTDTRLGGSTAALTELTRKIGEGRDYRAADSPEALAEEAAGPGEVEVAVHHLAAPQRADQLADSLRQKLGDRIRALYTSEVGAVVAAHVGPGLAGVVVHRLPG